MCAHRWAWVHTHVHNDKHKHIHMYTLMNMSTHTYTLMSMGTHTCAHCFHFYTSLSKMVRNYQSLSFPTQSVNGSSQGCWCWVLRWYCFTHIDIREGKTHLHSSWGKYGKGEGACVTTFLVFPFQWYPKPISQISSGSQEIVLICEPSPFSFFSFKHA